MNKKLTQRFHELKVQLEALEQTQKRVSSAFGTTDTIDNDLFTNWKVKVRNLLVTACGEDSQHFKAFVKGEESNYSMESQLSILKRVGAIFDATKEDYEGGYLNSLKQLVQAEVFESELEQAEELLSSGYKLASAVIAGVVLETALRDICTDNEIPHGSLNVMNAQLAKQGIYSKLQQKQVTAIADIRNSAAHGKPEQFSEQDVKNMIRDIEAFLLSYMA
ncbi:hypothetical protein PVK64_19765 [Aliivibrio sp. S4TY2]|uniref:hypothetical protein n=1 Tax=unclassified Aliivibrio TaxID=2645654 RepID=UPI002378A07D|nr:MULTISPECIES: hypothetical protein [unclassified Aliivibrio]MDD9158406.1 hypothetical protein [Aliivibrio sp. S4TY2]MDD9162406.1 hypothetical protein [Aliivibrio sp. S4TY1]MDD9166413.1 hypothetical protein [Aliivibrio sp. S4MY2]MDD9170411.1 hypothetical protein [Aliivibrio sp. S4MY4]MDD9187479.1 hypothetical protein [Aliivibrio sp. S4MY3]